MSIGIIYKVINKINNKCYIGQTIGSLCDRKRKHYWASKNKSCYFHNALNKYNKDGFSWEILEYCDSKEELDEMEFHYIMQYDSFVNGYNLTLGGEGAHGYRPSDNTKKKMSLSAKKRGSNHTNYRISDSTKKRMSEAAKNRVRSPHSKEHCRNISKSKKGHIVSEETKLKISSTLKGRFVGKNNPTSKMYVITYPDNKQVVVYGLSQICSVNKLSTGTLYMCISGERKQHKGFKCRYYNTDTDKNISMWSEK